MWDEDALYPFVLFGGHGTLRLFRQCSISFACGFDDTGRLCVVLLSGFRNCFGFKKRYFDVDHRLQASLGFIEILVAYQ
jgi:hypothetical protein